MSAGTNPVDPLLWPASGGDPNTEMPTVEFLQKLLWKDDPVFTAWTNAMPDKHWSKYDLSAVRLGYELGKRA